MTELQEIAIFVIGILFVIGIGMYIARDARKRAPVADPEHPNAPDHHRRSGPQQKKERSRAKAARRARKRNRH